MVLIFFFHVSVVFMLLNPFCMLFMAIDLHLIFILFFAFVVNCAKFQSPRMFSRGIHLGKLGRISCLTFIFIVRIRISVFELQRKWCSQNIIIFPINRFALPLGWNFVQKQFSAQTIELSNRLTIKYHQSNAVCAGAALHANHTQNHRKIISTITTFHDQLT